MAYTDIDDPSAYFQTTLYTGNDNARAITNTGNSDLQPDWVWIKTRSNTTTHSLFDSVRGALYRLQSNNSDSESSQANTLTAFNSDGFSLGTRDYTNDNNATYVAWQWKAGTSFTNDASGTGIGTIDSAGSASDASGFSIVSYTGTGSAGTIKHGLSSAPKMIIAKDRASGSLSWFVGHASLGFTKRLKLDGTNDAADNTVWNNTNPTSSVFSVGSSANANTSGNAIIAYCFAEKKGYSKFGSYAGVGNADGAFVYTGFKPAWFLVKRSNGSANWELYDNKRLGYNSANPPLYPDLSNAEGGSGRLDFLSNGVKMRAESGNLNDSGGSYIYMAFAEQPFVTSTSIPATER